MDTRVERRRPDRHLVALRLMRRIAILALVLSAGLWLGPRLLTELGVIGPRARGVHRDRRPRPRRRAHLRRGVHPRLPEGASTSATAPVSWRARAGARSPAGRGAGHRARHRGPEAGPRPPLGLAAARRGRVHRPRQADQRPREALLGHGAGPREAAGRRAAQPHEDDARSPRASSSWPTSRRTGTACSAARRARARSSRARAGRCSPPSAVRRLPRSDPMGMMRLMRASPFSSSSCPWPPAPLRPPPSDWPAYGRDPGGARYSPLTQITARQRRPAGGGLDLPHRRGRRRRRARPPPALEATPLVVDGTMYLSTPLGRVDRARPRDRRERWRYDPGVDSRARATATSRTAASPTGATARAAAGAVCARRIFLGDDRRAAGRARRRRRAPLRGLRRAAASSDLRRGLRIAPVRVPGRTR